MWSRIKSWCFNGIPAMAGHHSTDFIAFTHNLIEEIIAPWRSNECVSSQLLHFLSLNFYSSWWKHCNKRLETHSCERHGGILPFVKLCVFNVRGSNFSANNGHSSSSGSATFFANKHKMCSICNLK